MKEISGLPGRGKVAYVGDDISAFRVLDLTSTASLPRLSLPATRSSVPETLFFTGKNAGDKRLLEECLSLPLLYLVLGGRWPRTIPALFRSKAEQNGIRLIGPCSEGVSSSPALKKNSGNTVLLSEGGELLLHCLLSFRRRGIPVRYAFSFGRAADYSLIEAATAILESDEGADFFVFILENIRDGRNFLDFARSASGKGKRTAVLRLVPSREGLREEEAALKQYGVALLNAPEDIVDGAVAFYSLPRALRKKTFSHYSPSAELSLLLKKEAERAGFTSDSGNSNTPSLFIEVVSEREPDEYLRERKERIEKAEFFPFFTSLGVDAPMEQSAAETGIPFIAGFRRCFEALSLLMEKKYAAGSETSSAPLLKCPLHPQPTEYDAKVLLRAYNIPVAREFLCRSLAEALAAAESIGYPVALKVMSPSILHKTEARVIALNVQNEEELRNAYGRTLEKARIADPSARIRGVLVQEMVRGGTEWRIEYRREPRYGPMVEMSISGIYGDILPDGVLRAAPFHKDEALAMIRQSKGYPLLLEGWRRERLDIEAFASALADFSRLAFCEQGISRLDVNPIFVNRSGVLVVDAFVEKAGRKGKSNKSPV